MIDATAFGALHIQIFHTSGVTAHSMLITRNEAQELLQRLKQALAEPQELETFVPDN